MLKPTAKSPWTHTPSKSGKPFFKLIKPSTRLYIFTISDIHHDVSSSGSITSEMIVNSYIPHVWNRSAGYVMMQPRLLVWDNAPQHNKDVVKEAMSRPRNKTTVKDVPRGMTPLLQPLDVAVNKVKHDRG